jgi:hypothetical protein
MMTFELFGLSRFVGVIPRFKSGHDRTKVVPPVLSL